MGKRISIMLPDETVKVLDRVAAKGDRGRFISEAILHYVRTRSRADLRERLKQGALANKKLDLEIAREWFPVENEAWQGLEREEQQATETRGSLSHGARPGARARDKKVITSKVSIPPYPNEALIQPGQTGLPVTSTIRLDQIRTVDRQRLLKRLGQVDASTMRRLDEAIKISLGLLEI